MAKPKLALIPAAQGTSLYSVLPSSGVGDFQFNRSGSATRINSQGLIETVASGVSRLNYPMIDGVVKGCPHHILEPLSTNRMIQSENLSTGWANIDVSVETNSIISPDGTLNADKITQTNATSDRIQQQTLTTSSDVTISCFVKSTGVETRFRLGSATSSHIKITSNADGTMYIYEYVADNYFIENYGNGWYRVGFTFSASTSLYCQLYPDVRGLGGSIYVWGSQFEVNPYLTSYIPTTTAIVTRSAETATGSGDAATFNDSEGVLMAEVSKDKGTQYSLISLQKSSVSDTYAYIGYLNNNTTIRGQIKVGGTTVLNEEIEMSDTSIVAKILIKYKSGDYSMWVNGFEIGSNTNSTIFSDGDLNEIELGINNNNSFRFYGNTKQLQYFDTALTDSELEQISSWVSFQDMAEGQLYTIE